MIKNLTMIGAFAITLLGLFTHSFAAEGASFAGKTSLVDTSTTLEVNASHVTMGMPL